METQIKILKAFHGDCILIKTFDAQGSPYNILVDGGTSKTFEQSLRQELSDIKIIHLLVLTHIDSDHIGGLIRFFQSDFFDEITIEKYWINGPNLLRISSGEETSFGQGKALEGFIDEKEPKDNLEEISFGQGKTLEGLIYEKEPKDKWEDQVYIGSHFELAAGINCKILSPTKEILNSLYQKWPELEVEKVDEDNDVSISSDIPLQLGLGTLPELATIPFEPSKTIKADLANSSSIAFLLELKDCSILLLGDSRAEVVEKALRDLKYDEKNPLVVDYVKISHHGSKYNTSCDFLDLIDSQHFIISTGGSRSHQLPNREVIARILFHPRRDQSRKKTIYFNYPLESIEENSGVFIYGADMKIGNWEYKDNVTTLFPVRGKNNS